MHRVAPITKFFTIEGNVLDNSTYRLKFTLDGNWYRVAHTKGCIERWFALCFEQSFELSKAID
jgi:hypothetical protein